jgi:hypothetical protein
MVALIVLTTACRRMIVWRLVPGMIARFFGTWNSMQRISVGATKQVSAYRGMQENQQQNQIFNEIGIAIHRL